MKKKRISAPYRRNLNNHDMVAEQLDGKEGPLPGDSGLCCTVCIDIERAKRDRNDVLARRLYVNHPKCTACGMLFGGEHKARPIGETGLCQKCSKGKG